MKSTVLFILLILTAGKGMAETGTDAYTLSGVIAYGLAHNARVRAAQANIDIERSSIGSANADRLPRLDLNGGVTQYRYPTPVSPLYGTPPANLAFPEFDNTIYDAGVSFTLPLYRGGRLDRGVTVAELRKSLAEDSYRMNRQELVYNLTSTYFKILQLEKLHRANEETVKQLEAHKANVELFFKAGTVPRVDLLKTETALAHANQAELVSRNSLESAYELLKTFMGVEDMGRKLTLAEEPVAHEYYPPLEEGQRRALEKRPDYQASSTKLRINEEQVGIAQGKRLPSVNLAGEYTERSGADMTFRENWAVGLRLTVPLFEAGAISSDVGRARSELVKSREEERALRLEIMHSVRDAYLGIENARKRVEVTEKAIASARENERIELLRYKTGAGTSMDVIDAQTALLIAETDYYQAWYDRAIALAALRRALGEDPVNEEATK